MRESLIVRTGGTGKFLHDRIQQAAYSLIPEAERAGVHLRIGRVLLANLTADELAEHVFDVANQFNRGAALLIERDEKAQVAALDLRAGRRAKSSAAYASACVYLAAGMGLLDDSDWASHYELMFSLWLERAECEFLTGRFDQAEQLIDGAIAARRVESRSGGRLPPEGPVAYREVGKPAGRRQRAGVPAPVRHRPPGTPDPRNRSRPNTKRSGATWRGARSRALIDLPLMTDPELQAAMRLLSTRCSTPPTLPTSICFACSCAAW